MGIYEQLKQANVPLDNHESDLYAKVTLESRNILQGYEFLANVQTFKSQIDNTLWYDIPFAYQPYWESKFREVL
jgi:hypothetical protein